ncbi:FAD-dependent urate hydroxylase [Tolypocladium paradoxum]|uniref:FAD-dependent urate hydroxylase n=1 Tax=Tolypocladium paradoxum TaxID=94208 RepID=A0A2S4KYS5_9HYPO|nr:FAD-dependent urate hydroxylase [Tolypocladium paradoxum]
MVQSEQSQLAGLRAIVVGAGITGLTAAHTLHKAGIDYVVVEKWPDAAPPAGASIGLFPSTLRVLQQLGLLEHVERLAEPFTDGASNRDPKGKLIMNSDLWGRFRENHGRDVLMLERRAFLETLYDTLPDKSRVHFNKKIEKIVENADGVEISFSDGTTERGDFVLGADGVHSVVRQAMWDHANTVEPGLITVDEKMTIMTTWTCLFGFGPGEPNLGNELSVSSFDGSRCILLATQPKQSFFFVFWKPKKPWSRYTRPRYTEQDAEEAAKSVADLPINETMVFAELWKKRHRAQLADIEEGVLSRWHYGRHVLVGDAAHKVTPNMALGGNLGIESVTVLTNLLRKALVDKKGPGKLKVSELKNVLEEFQAQQLPRAQAIFEVSSSVSRAQAWDSLWLKFTSIYIAPRSNPRALPDGLGEIMRAAPILDFVPVGKWPEGRLEWVHGDAAGKRSAEATPSTPATNDRAGSQLVHAAKLVVGGIAAASIVSWVLQAIVN